MRPKKIGTVSSSLCTIVLACAIFSSTEVVAKEYKIKNGHSSGSSITSLFNFQAVGGDSRTSLSTFQGKDTLGDVHGQIVTDYDAFGDCTAGPGVRFFVYMAQGVLNYKKGQLFLVADDSSSPNDGCMQFLAAPPGPAQVALTIEYDIVGGTGDYEGASGKLTSTSTGMLLYNDITPGNDDQFGSFDSTYEGWFEAD